MDFGARPATIHVRWRRHKTRPIRATHMVSVTLSRVAAFALSASRVSIAACRVHQVHFITTPLYHVPVTEFASTGHALAITDFLETRVAKSVPVAI